MTTPVHDEQLETLGELLADLVRGGLGARSQWALRAALDGAQTEGIAGVMTITIPARTRDRIDVGFTVGAVEFVTRMAAG